MEETTVTNNDTEINNGLNEVYSKKDDTNGRKRKLSVCIAFGEQLSELATQFSSLKLLGKEIAERFPESQRMDSACRTRCKWLYEALHKPGHAANDILSVLGLQTIYDLCERTWNPTVIFRMYAKAKAQAMDLAA